MKGFLFCLLALVTTSAEVVGQGAGGFGGGFGGGGNGLGGGGGGGGGQFPGGILIHPDGLIDRAMIAPLTSSSNLKQMQERARKNLPRDLMSVSPIRKVSLRRLEQRVAELLTANQLLPEDVLYLAGLTRIEAIYIDRENNDVILAGPAEGFARSKGGRILGVQTGRPVLCLEDLLIALRDEDIVEKAGCSIDPEPARLRDSQAWLQQNSSPATADVAKARLEHMIEILGRWNVTTYGAPEDSRIACTMVEADYLMKRIAIGVEKVGVRGLKTSFALTETGDNMMRRWWFVPDYTAITRNEESTAWTLAGPRLKLMAQEEVMDKNGNVQDIDLKQKSSEGYAASFNEHLEQLTEKVAAFADLQNIFDMLLAASIIRRSRESELIQWEAATLLDSESLPTPVYRVPRETPSMLNIKMGRGSVVLGVFTGGVTFRAGRMLDDAGLPGGEDKDASRSVPKPPADQPERWWWDD
ncbi:MAG: DUF1598 domain-containing protein [Planctomycetaceae bacterium]|nr:DUF1598 domain-containing protein [Planctomycetaceae bacterium]